MDIQIQIKILNNKLTAGQMDLPCSILPRRGVLLFRLPNEPLIWICDKSGTACLLVGFASDNPMLQTQLDFMVKFHFTEKKRKVFNSIEPLEEYPVRHTRVSRTRVSEWDENIATRVQISTKTTNPKEDQVADWLAIYYAKHYPMAMGELHKLQVKHRVQNSLCSKNIASKITKEAAEMQKLNNKKRKAGDEPLLVGGSEDADGHNAPSASNIKSKRARKITPLSKVSKKKQKTQHIKPVATSSSTESVVIPSTNPVSVFTKVIETTKTDDAADVKSNGTAKSKASIFGKGLPHH